MRRHPVGSKLARSVLIPLLAVALGGCGSGDDGGPAPPPPPPPGNDAPTAQITVPADGSTFEAGTEIEFQGSGNDPEDGNLTGAALVWTSDRDGEIGTGTSFARSDLSEGTHTITLTATDSEGESGTATVSITVGAEADIAAEILLVDNGDGFAFVDPQGRRNENATVTIQVGQTVRWRYEQSGATNHTVTSGEGQSGSEGDGVPEGASEALDSGALNPGDTFEFTFETAGTWTYFCEFHPTDMFNSTVVVEEP